MGCTSGPDPIFELRRADHTGLHFNNEIMKYASDTLNPLNFEYMFNGGGVGAGDLNNDGLLDLFFAGSIESSALYLNEGSLKFRDVTEAAGVGTSRWCSGVTMVDINQDGWLDIYVSVTGRNVPDRRKNYLFINQGTNDDGVPTFREMAENYGLDDGGYTVMTAFFDYDKDGDLDAYLLGNALEMNKSIVRQQILDGSAPSNDRFYKNNGDGTFTDVTVEAGILFEGWGLGVNISDINQDGWSDIYVANDFLSNDILWINNGDGTFVNKINEYTMHQTHNGMGVDVADFNNDMLPDIAVVDMLPPDNYREKMMIPEGNYDKFLMQHDFGYQQQYMRNTLQLNQGKMPDGSLKFSEIGFLANIAKTDWSWAPLFADFDHDGLKDLFVANGFRMDITNLDYVVYHSEGTMFGREEDRKRKALEALMALPEVKLNNYMFKNNGDLTFEDVTETWGLNIPTYSNGAIYADLDNDGDLDIVTNNIDDKVFLFENKLNKVKNKENGYLRLKLTAEGKKISTYSTKVWISAKGSRQYLEFSPVRGYKSTVEPYLHFGLSNATQVDTVRVIWPDGNLTTLNNVALNQLITIDHSTSAAASLQPEHDSEIGLYRQRSLYFTNITEKTGLNKVIHDEKFYNDFKDTPMLPHLLSKYGPYIAVGDLNADGLDDFVLSGDVNVATSLYFQTEDGRFQKSILPGDSAYEDREIAISDLNADGHPDIYVSSGGSMFHKDNERYQDRIYIGNGKGDFKPDPNLLPSFHTSTGTVKVTDVDRDGDMDLFVGGRLIPRSYPYPPKSYLLIFEKGKFWDVTQKQASELENIGMVTDATWADVNKDQLPDLIIVGEWMPVSIFENDGNGNLTNKSEEYGLSQRTGWYNSVHATDLDLDGSVEIIVGNYGLNSNYRATSMEPLQIVAKDYDGTGSIDPILTHYSGGKRYITFFRDRLINQINTMKGRFIRYESFATTTFEQAFTAEELEGAIELNCTELASGILKNNGEGKYLWETLPIEAQFSPIHGLVSSDLNSDRLPEIIAVGNSYAEEPIFGWQDASYGNVLINKGELTFANVKPSRSGILAQGDTKKIAEITIAGKKSIIVTRNGESLLVFQLNEQL